MSKIVINQDFNFVSDSDEIVTNLNGLSDVNITAAADGQILVYNGSSSEWENVSNSELTALNALSDVTITTPSDEQFLRYDSGTSQWINETVTLTTNLDGLTDVTITSVSDEQFLRYDSSTNQWINETVSSLGVSALDDLTDVTITTPSDGQYLAYNGSSSEWENVTVTFISDITGENLEDLGNVASGASTGDILYRAGGNWTPTDTIEIQPTTRVVFNDIAEILYPNTSASQLVFENTTNNGITGDIAAIKAESENSAGTTKLFASMSLGVGDKTSLAEDGYINFVIQNNGSFQTHFKIEPNNVYGTRPFFGLVNSSNTQEIYMENTSAHGAATISAFTAYGRDSASAVQKYTSIQNLVVDDTAGSEDANIVFNTVQNGTLTESFKVGSTNRLSTPTFQTNYFQIDKGSAEPILYLVRTGSTTDDDRIGAVEFYNVNDAAEFGRQVSLDAFAVDVTDGTEDGQLIVSVTANGAISQRLQIHPDNVSTLNARFIANNKATLKSDGAYNGIQFDTGTGENTYRINIANATGNPLAAGDQSQLIGWEITATDQVAYPVLLGAQYDDGTDGNAFLFKAYDDGVSTFTPNTVAKIAENRTALYRSLNLAPYASGSLPASPETGDMVRVTDENNAPYYYDGTEWLNLYDIDGGTY